MHYLKKNIRTMLAALVLCCISCDNGLAPQLQDSLPPYTDGSSIISIEIIDSVGGTFIQEQTTLTIYDSSTQEPVWKPIAITRGKIRIPLLKDKYYTFKLSGKPSRLAGSTLENYAVTKAAQNLTLIQRKPQIGAAVEAPSITGITLNSQPFGDNQECANDAGTVLTVEFHAPSRAIQPAPKVGNFGCAFSIGTSASAYSNVRETTPQCKQNTDGSWNCTATFSLHNIPFLPGTETLSITAYDLAGNRIERHINNVTFKNNTIDTGFVPPNIAVQDFQVEMVRYPHSIRLFTLPDNTFRPFGLHPHDGRNTSYETKIWFLVKHTGSGSNIPITAFDIYRRKQGEADWQRVGRKQYTQKYSGFDSFSGVPPSYLGKHLAYDTTPIEEGVTYEYKVKAFIKDTVSVESHIGTVRLLPACTIRLESPADNSMVKKSALDTPTFTFCLTNPAIWEEKQADFFDFGILITEKTSEEKTIFAGKITIALKASAGNRLSIRLSDKKDYRLSELKQKGIIAESVIEDDLISYHNGHITLKPAYFVKQLNSTNTIPEFKSGYTYSWEIFDWTINEPARFAAVWKTKDSTGNIIDPGKLHTCDTVANTLRAPGSLNGHFYFRVTDN